MTLTLPKNKPINDPYIAFTRVDEQVSKPIVGNDGAFAWKTFIKHNKTNAKSTAPELPSKRTDRLQGFKNLQEERDYELKVNNENIDIRLTETYFSFKEKLNPADIHKIKKEDRIRKRLRPDTSQYFVKSARFEGKKSDYIFTTKDRGTGYYWDGMDSYFRLVNMKEESSMISKEQELPDMNFKRPKQKPTKANDLSKYNALEDIERAIQRRNLIFSNKNSMYRVNASLKDNETRIWDVAVLSGNNCKKNTSSSSTIDSLELTGWETACDPLSKRLYYFHRKSGQRRWDFPILSSRNNEQELKDGWKTAKDPASGLVYYYNENTGDSSWNIPKQ